MSSRNRRSCGRMSGLRWNWPVVWPLTWQSKQATPMLRLRALAVVGRVELLLRQRRQQQPQPFELHRRQDLLEQLAEVVDARPPGRATRRPARAGSGGRWPAGTRAGTPRAGRSRRRTAPAAGTCSICICGKTCPPLVCSGCGSDGYGKAPCLLDRRPASSRPSFSQVMPFGQPGGRADAERLAARHLHLRVELRRRGRSGSPAASAGPPSPSASPRSPSSSPRRTS